jgi:tyrosine-protein kinase Etk/Wzc
MEIRMANAAGNLLEEKGSSFNIRLLLFKYLQYWYFFILSIALALGGAYWYLRYTTPIYQISAVLLIRDHPKSTSDEILKEGENAF